MNWTEGALARTGAPGGRAAAPGPGLAVGAAARRGAERTLLLLLLALAGGCTRGKPASAPEDDPKLMELMLTELREALPGVEVSRKDARTIHLESDAGTQELFLDNLQVQCRTSPRDCAGARAARVRSLRQLLRGAQAAPDRRTVRALLKDPAWMAGVRQLHQASPEGRRERSAVVSRPWLAGLSLVYVFDLPDGMRFLNRGDQADLGLDDAALDALARANLDRALPPPTASPVAELPGVLAVREGEDYAALQLLFPERFAGLAGQLGGTLVVSAPTRDLLLVARGSDPAALERLGTAVRSLVDTEAYPVSAALLDWSPAGFTERR